MLPQFETGTITLFLTRGVELTTNLSFTPRTAEKSDRSRPSVTYF